jgi:large subunit ribosomal protein L15
MPLSRRLPKKGFRNPSRKNIVIVNVEELKEFPAGSVIDRDALLGAGLVKKAGDGIKVLGKGDIDHAISLKVDMISRAAKNKIEAAGGSVVGVI